MQPEYSKSTGQPYRVSRTCARVALITSHQRMCLRAAFRAKTSALLVAEQGWTENAADCGGNTSASFASYDHATSSWKTRQLSFFPSSGMDELSPQLQLAEFLGTWPAAGTMRNGLCSPRALWVPHTHGKECSSWPTPTKSESLGGGSANEARMALAGERRPSGARIILRLRDLIKHLHGGPVNPVWIEWLMGFPEEWTALED